MRPVPPEGRAVSFLALFGGEGVGGDAVENFGGFHDGFGKRRMRMDDSARSRTVAPISMATTPSAINSPAPWPTMPTPRMRSVSGSINQFGQAVGAIIGQRAAGCAPREFGDFNFQSFCARLGFGQAAPGQFGIGENDGGNDDARGGAFVADDGFDGDARFLAGLVRQQNAAGDVADGENGGIGWSPVCR